MANVRAEKLVNTIKSTFEVIHGNEYFTEDVRRISKEDIEWVFEGETLETLEQVLLVFQELNEFEWCAVVRDLVTKAIHEKNA